MVGTIILNIICIIGAILQVNANINLFKYIKANKLTIGDKYKYTDFIWTSGLNIAICAIFAIQFIIGLF